jgi:hypothetical protein
MTDSKSPVHAVDYVRANNDRPRIALVGFWRNAD